MKILVADVGGTNARFAVVSGCERQSVGQCEMVRRFKCTDFTNFEAMVGAYLADLGEQPIHACFGLAGPVQGNVGKLTNSGFLVDSARLAQQFGFRQVRLVNDLAAMAAGVPHLQADARLALQGGGECASGPMSVIGVGTGFGAAIVVPHPGGWIISATEAGHQAFAPADELENDILRMLRKTHLHVSLETLLSGAGLCHLHRCLARLSGAYVDELNPEEIAFLASSGDPLCRQAVQLLFSMLGAAAGDVALAHGAISGVYLGGGVVTKNQTWLRESRLIERFSAKGPMTQYNRGIPLYAICSEHVALAGAAYWFLGMVC